MGFILNLFDTYPYLIYVLGLVVALVLYQKVAPRMKIRVPGASMTGEDLIGKILGRRHTEWKLQKGVARYKKQGHFLAAGKLLEDSNKMAEAVDAYIGGQEYFAAASVLERMGKLERAAELYLQSGDYKKSAQVLIDAGKPAKAAALFQEKGNNLEAARLYGLAQVWDKSAELYAKSGYPLRAAEAYEKKGPRDFVKAAECYEQHFMENVSFSTTYTSTAPGADQRSALLSGRLYEKAGEQARAFQIYSKGGYFKEAASVSMGLKQFTKAAELYMKAEDPESAARAFEEAGDKVQAANLRGEVALKADRTAEAARFFQQGQDYLRAAELFESIGMLAEAAGAYEAGDSFAAAGSVYIRAGLKDRAAASYERAADLETAAKLYEEAGNGSKAIELYERCGLTFKSGEAAAKAGDREKAMNLLQRVGPSDENYLLATELLAQLFIVSGRPSLAIERVQKVLAGQPITGANLVLNYWLAAGYEASNQVTDAVSLYKKILAEDLQFRDVDKRLRRLQSGVSPVGGVTQPSADSHPAPAPRTAAPPAPRPAAPPAPRGPRFVKQEEAGKGPLGTVFRAVDQTDGRSVALRVLPAEILGGSVPLQEVVADLKAAGSLSHPNVVKVLGFVDMSGQRCVVSEFVQGRNLSEALRSGVRMGFQQVHGLGRVLAQALSFIHGKGLVHGSIQPSNVMVASGVVKIADLGLGRLSHSLTNQSDYRAAENTRDVHGDLYNMSALLYHLLTGTHPKAQPQGSALPLPSKLAMGVPETFDKLLLRCLHPRQELRFATAEDILHELKDMVRIG